MTDRLTFKVIAGHRTLLSRTTSWVQALRALVDNAEVIVEVGHAHVIRSDGVVMCGVDLDLGVSMRRK
jgi:hypothetical protein